MIMTRMYLLALLYLLPVLVRSEDPPCTDYAVTECNKDENAELFSLDAESQANCQQFCEDAKDCLFYAYYKTTVMNVNCHLFREPFHVYLDHCDVHSGPLNQNPPSKCFNPDGNSCEVEQFEDCVLYGTVLERNIAAPDVTICEEFCRLNEGGGCRYWQWNREKESCDLFDSADKVCNIVFGPKDFTPQQCQSTETTEGYLGQTKRTVNNNINCRFFNCLNYCSYNTFNTYYTFTY